MNTNAQYSLHNERTQTANDKLYQSRIGDHYSRASGTNLDKLRNFTKFVPRQSLATFLAKNDIFRQIVNIHGAIIECGIFTGGGLFTWAQLSAIYEPYNHNRRVVGFDSFDGFQVINDEDNSEDQENINSSKHKGGYKFAEIEELSEEIDLFDLNRPLGHIKKIEIIQGDALETIPQYISSNPHLVVACLILDFDLYEPTLTALQTFLPRIPKGGVLVFDELNQAQWPGETLAVMKQIGISNLKIERFPFTPFLSYSILE